MSDVVVTVPKSFGLETWIAEGDPAGARWSGQEWDFYLGGAQPDIREGERVYVVYNGAVRGYAPLIRIDYHGGARFSLVRGGGAVAVTIPEVVRGFRGWRYRWWERAVEVPFPNWRDATALPPAPCAHPPAARREITEDDFLPLFDEPLASLRTEMCDACGADLPSPTEGR